MSQHKTRPGRDSRGRRERGAGVAEAVMTVMVMMMLAVPFMSRMAAKPGTQLEGQENESAICLAESGVDKAVWELNKGAWAGTENISTKLTMTIDGFETPGRGIAGDLRVSLMPFDLASGTRLVEATGSVRRGNSELTETVMVVLRKQADEYAIACWLDPPASQ